MADTRITGIEAYGPLTEVPSQFVGKTVLLGELASILQQSNGFTMFGGAFVALPSGSCDYVPTIEAYNSHRWKDSYSPSVQNTLFFALDTSGYPFGVADGMIVHLDPETGSMDPVAETISSFLDRVWKNPYDLIDLAIFEEWFDSGKTFELSERLAPVFPFILGGGETIDDLYAADILERAEFNAYIYEQLKDVPDGVQVELRCTD